MIKQLRQKEEPSTGNEQLTMFVSNTAPRKSDSDESDRQKSGIQQPIETSIPEEPIEPSNPLLKSQSTISSIGTHPSISQRAPAQLPNVQIPIKPPLVDFDGTSSEESEDTFVNDDEPTAPEVENITKPPLLVSTPSMSAIESTPIISQQPAPQVSQKKPEEENIPAPVIVKTPSPKVAQQKPEEPKPAIVIAKPPSPPVVQQKPVEETKPAIVIAKPPSPQVVQVKPEEEKKVIPAVSQIPVPKVSPLKPEEEKKTAPVVSQIPAPKVAQQKLEEVKKPVIESDEEEEDEEDEDESEEEESSSDDEFSNQRYARIIRR